MIPIFELNEKLPSSLDSVCPFIERVLRIISDFTGQRDEIFNLKLALEEALTNAMRHGNVLNTVLYVNVHIKADKDKVIFDIHDQGKGFDFLDVPDPTKEPNLHNPSGRGVFLMRKVMDKVEYYDGGSGVRMTKFLPEKNV